jgi:MATE family multidrug resistance protein
MGFWMALVYISAGVLLYVLAPGACMYFFRNERDPNWAHVAELVPVLLRFVAVYSLFDTMNIVFSFALRGAGDTRFVTIVSLFLAWPIMVLPTWAAWKFGWGLYWAWGFASAYVIALGITFLLRFQAGKWKSMRVIERTRPGMSVDGQVLGQTGQEQKSEVPPANNASILEATN